MNIQSMLVIVDSLSGEISKQFDNVMSLTNTLPDVNRGNEGRINRFQDTFDTEKDTTLLTGSIVVNSQSKLKDQKKLFQRSISNLNNYKASLQNVQANINFRTKSVNRYLVEIHKKFSIPFACIVFIILGAPIGIMTKRGNFGVAALISTVILTFYWISLIQGEKLADRLFVSPFIGMWSFNIVFSIIGIILLIRLTTEFRFVNLFSKDDQ